MTTWALLAPGPSASAEQAAQVLEAGIPLGAIGNAFALAPHAQFVAATDGGWWRKHPEAKSLPCRKFTMHTVPDLETVTAMHNRIGRWESGVDALTWDEIETQSGVSRQQIEELAILYKK